MRKQTVASHAKNIKLTSQSTSSKKFDFVSENSIKKEDNILVSSEMSPSIINGYKKGVSHFTMQENSPKAKTFWAMKLVASHSSFNSFSDISDML